MIYREAVDFINKLRENKYIFDNVLYADEGFSEVIRLLELGGKNKEKVMELEGKIIELTRPPRGFVDPDCPGGACPIR